MHQVVIGYRVASIDHFGVQMSDFQVLGRTWTPWQVAYPVAWHGLICRRSPKRWGDLAESTVQDLWLKLRTFDDPKSAFVCQTFGVFRYASVAVASEWQGRMSHQWSRGIRELMWIVMWVAHPPSLWIVMWIDMNWQSDSPATLKGAAGAHNSWCGFLSSSGCLSLVDRWSHPEFESRTL